MTKTKRLEFVVDLNPEHNPFYKYGLIGNPFAIRPGLSTKDVVLEGLAKGCAKEDLPYLLPSIGLKGREAEQFSAETKIESFIETLDDLPIKQESEIITLIMARVEENKRYQIIVTWDEVKQEGTLLVKELFLGE